MLINKKSFFLFFSLAIIIFFIGKITQDNQKNQQSQKSQQSLIPVQVKTLENAILVDQTNLVGVLQAERKAVVRSENEGRVEQVFVSLGDKIKAGTPLVQLNNRKYFKTPIAGVVNEILVNPGEFVIKGQELAEIINTQSLLLNLIIPTEYTSKLKIGLPVKIVNSNDKITHTCRISFISNKVESSSQSILTKAKCPPLGSNFRSGQYIKVGIIWGTSTGILVPTSAVTAFGSHKLVFVVEESEAEDEQSILIAKQKYIEVGGIQNTSYQVLSGLKPGDKIVVSQILNLRDGMPIKVDNIQP